MRILACDLATATGFAIGDADGEPRYGTLKLPSTGEDVGAFLLAFDCWLRDIVALERPTVLCFEAPIFMSGRTSIQTARKLMGLASHCEFVCADLRLTCREANIMTVKSFFAGTGRASKDDMIAAARRFGWFPKNDNEADSLAVWSYSVHTMAPAHAARFRMGLMGARA